MKGSRKLFTLLVLLLAGFVLVACNQTTTEAPTTAAPTTEAPTTVAPTTEAPTTVAPTTEAPTTTAAPDLMALVADLEAHYADTLGDDNYVVMADITLLGTIGGVTITWASSNTAVVEDDGTVHQPSFEDGDQTAVLTATLTHGDDSESTTFFATVQALAKTDQERADEAFMTVAIFPAKEYWSSLDSDDLAFLTTATDGDDVEYTVVWTSSHPDVISAEGVIIQPEGAAQLVTMTATITINSVDFTHDVDFNVAMRPVVDATVATIAEAIALPIDSYVKIPAMTIAGIDSDGSVFFTDGVDVLFVYSPSYTVVIGEVYDMTGIVGSYYNAPQLGGTDEKPLYATASTEAAVATPSAVANDIYDILDNTSQPTAENQFSYTGYEVTASVYYNPDFSGNYSVFLVPTDYDFDADLEAGAIKPNGDAIMIYYKSDMEVLKAFHGQNVTIDIIMHGYRTDKSVFYADFYGDEADVEFFFETDQDAIDAALNKLTFPKFVLEAETLMLPASEFGVDLTYASDMEAIINSSTGVIDLTTVTTETNVTLTVTATYGTTTDTLEVVIPVGMPEVGTIADALAGANGYLFKVEGTVVAGGYYNTYFIQDDTDNIALYTYDDTELALLEANVGNVVEVLGVRSGYSGLEQLKPESVTYVEDGTAVTATNLDAMALDATLVDYQGELVELTDMVVADVYTDNYGNITITFIRTSDQEQIKMKWDSRFDLPTAVETALTDLVVGDKVNVTTVLGWYNNPLLYVTSTSVFVESTLSDADAAILDAYELMFGGTLYAGEVVTLPAAGTFGSVITWAITADVDMAAALAAGELTLTRPAADAVVTIEATVTMNAAVETKSFTFNLVALTDLVDALADDGNMVVVHGTVFAVIENGFFIEDATGKLFVYTDEDVHGYVAGDEVELIGEIGTYGNLVQLKYVDEYPAAVSTSNDVTQTPEVYVPGTTTLMSGYTYTVNGEVALEGSYNNVYIYLNATDKIVIYYKSPDLSIESLEALEGQAVSVDVIYYMNSYGDESFAFVGLAGDLDAVVDFTDLATIADEEIIFIQGVVSGMTANGLYIQDAAGLGINMYKPEGYDDGSVSVGDEVIYQGELDTYYDVRQLGYGASLIQVVSMGNTLVVTPLTLTELADSVVADDTNILFSVTGLEVTAVEASYIEFTAQDSSAADVAFRYYFSEDYEWLPVVYAVSDTLDAEFILATYYSSGYWKIDPLSTEMTEQMMFDVDVASIPDVHEFTETLVLEAGEFGSTYEVTLVTGDAATYLDWTTTAGSVVLLSQPVTDMTGVATVVVTKGTMTETVMLDVVVKAPVVAGDITELFISEYAEGSSSNKYIEIYNGTGADVDLAAYKLVLYSNGATTPGNTTDLTGILADGDVYIIYNSSADATIIAAGDVSSTVTYFNGDDVVVLTKDDVIIDGVLEVGHTNNDNVVNDMTLVRKPSITGPSTTFSLDDWVQLASDDWSDIGTHTVD